MAILEVHDGRGRVERVPFTRDEPFIFGSSPACTLVLNDPGIAPVHGRIRWQKRKYKVDAGAEVDAIEVNGKRIKTSTLYQGDEIRVGTSRLFVITTEDGNVEIPADDKTRIQSAPKAISSAPSQGVSRSAQVFESPSFPEILDQPTRAKSSKRRKARRDLLEADGNLEVRPVTAKPGFAGWLRSRLIPASDAPGKERVVSSPMVVGLLATLAILILSSFGLWKVIVQTTSQKQFSKAFDSLNDGDYRNAIKQLDQFLTSYPDDLRSGKARVFRSLAKVRQFTSNTGASWTNALQSAQEMVSEVGELVEYRDASTELSEQLVKVVEGLADRARSGADPESLSQAETALALTRQVAGQANENLVGRSRISTKLTQAREAIKRAETKAHAMTQLNAALASGSAKGAYAARDQLVAIYPDLATDRDLIGGLIKANELIRKAVAFDPSQRPGETEPHPDPLGPPTTLILRLDPGRAPAAIGSVVYAIADELAFGLDGATGAPLWQVPVGLSSPFAPIPIAGGDPAALLVDARYDELIRLDGRTGKLVWRQEIGERLNEPPLILGNEVIVATPSGKLLFLDLKNGSVRGTLNLGRPLTRSPVADESGVHLYQLADEDCLFILDRDPPACTAVEYLGHDSGSVACSPARVGRFLVVPENSSLKDGRWRVFVLDDTGAKIAPRQTIAINGWTWQSPTTAGSVIWSTSDRGEITAFSIGLYDADQPFKPIASLAAAADTLTSGPAFSLARSERELWLSSSRPGRYDLNTESGQLGGTWVLGQSGPAFAPIQQAEKLAVFTQQSLEGPGVALVAVDPQNGALRWRTTLGAPWPLPFVEGKAPGSIESLGFDGVILRIYRTQIEKGGFFEQPLAKPGQFRVPSVGAAWLYRGDTIVLVPDPTSSQLLVRSGEAKFRPIDLPSPLGARPIFWGKDVLIPGGDGRVYLIDPATGEFAADPFVPRFDKAHPSAWLTPMLLDEDAVGLVESSGLVRRLIKAITPRPHLVVTAETNLAKRVTTDPATTGATLLIATNDNKIRVLAARDLSPATTVEFVAPRTLGPVTVGRYGFASDALGNVSVFTHDGRKLWQTKLRTPLGEAPVLLDNSALFLTRAGTVELRSMADGAWIERLTLGILPAGCLMVVGQAVIVPSGLGSLRSILNIGKPTSTGSSND